MSLFRGPLFFHLSCHHIIELSIPHSNDISLTFLFYLPLFLSTLQNVPVFHEMKVIS